MEGEARHYQRHSKGCTSSAHCPALQGYLWKHHKVLKSYHSAISCHTISQVSVQP